MNLKAILKIESLILVASVIFSPYISNLICYRKEETTLSARVRNSMNELETYHDVQVICENLEATTTDENGRFFLNNIKTGKSNSSWPGCNEGCFSKPTLKITFIRDQFDTTLYYDLPDHVEDTTFHTFILSL